MAAVGDLYYRVENVRTTAGVSVFYTVWNVTKTTPRGVWLEQYGMARFVLNDAHKRFACPTKEQARESFRARKRRQIKILTAQLEHAKQALDQEPDANV